MNYFKFFYKSLALLAVLIAGDRLLGRLLEKYYYTQSSGIEYRTTYSIDSTREDVLIFGSSRANHHYHANVLMDSTHFSYFNTGVEGMDIMYSEAVLRCVLKRYKPKLVVLDVNRMEFISSQESYDHLSSLAPYYKRHPEIQDIVLRRTRFEKLKFLSAIYPYNSMMLSIAIGNMEFNKKRRFHIKGYVPNETGDSVRLSQVLAVQKPYLDKDYEMDPYKISMFEQFIRTCKDSSVNLVVVTSPYLTRFAYHDPSLNEVRRICDLHQVSYIDCSYMKGLSDDPQNFYDITHLSENGSKTFTRYLLKLLSERDTVDTAPRTYLYSLTGSASNSF